MKCCALAVALLSIVPFAVHAQSVSVVTRADSALLITTPGACPGVCPDSVRLEWRYGGQYITRKVGRRAVDTARVARNPANSNYADSARLFYTPLPPANNPKTLAAFVTPLSDATSPSGATTSRSSTASTPQRGATPTSSSRAATETSTAETAAVRARVRDNTGSATQAVVSLVSTSFNGSYVQPKAPATFSTAYPALSGRSRRVAAGQDLQAALNTAQPGDEIVLADGATFTGNFVLPVKSGNAWIVVRAEKPFAPPGTRTNPSYMTSVATIATANSDPALRTAPGAAHWRLVGFEIAHATGARYNYGIVVLGRGDERSLSELPSDIVLDRMYVHGATGEGNSRCVAFNGVRLAVINSWLTECHAKGQDAQGVGGWNGPGPFIIEDNHIEASGQGVMFGGADPAIQNVSPSDIVVRHNHFTKPLSWGRGRWTVKAVFELKHGRRVLFEGNVMENHWADAQTGFAILFQTLADNNRSWAWTTVQDVLVQNNILRNSTSGVNLLARVAYNGGTMPTNPTSRIAIINNLFENVGRDPISNIGGIVLQLLGDLQDVTYVQNTTTLAGGSAQKGISFDGKPEARTIIADNVFPAATYAVTGNQTGAGTPTLNAFMPGGIFRSNVMPGQAANVFPGGALTSTARGVNMAELRAATAGVVK